MESNRRVEEILKLLMYGTSAELSDPSNKTALSPGGEWDSDTMFFFRSAP